MKKQEKIEKEIKAEKEKVSNLRQQLCEMKRFAKTRSFDFISAGLSVVAGFAWNEAIKSLIEYLFPIDQNTIIAKFLYALLITLFVIILVYSMSKILGIKPKAKSKENKK